MISHVLIGWYFFNNVGYLRLKTRAIKVNTKIGSPFFDLLALNQLGENRKALSYEFCDALFMFTVYDGSVYGLAHEDENHQAFSSVTHPAGTTAGQKADNGSLSLQSGIQECRHSSRSIPPRK